MTLDHVKIRIDLDDCQQALSAWWDIPSADRPRNAKLHLAIEALLRAVSTLAHGLEAGEVGS